MLDCQTIIESLKGSTLVQACDLSSDDFVRLMTPFKYPDGSNVDVFVMPEQPLFEQVVVTDYGQTLDWLSDLNIDPTATKRRKAIVASICLNLGIEFDGWQIRSKPVGMNAITGAMLDVGQACIRVADLVYTQRLQSVSIMKDEVEEFIADLGLLYEEDAEVPVRTGELTLRVDFRVVSPRRTSLIQLLPTGSHVTANSIIRRWYEIRRAENPGQYLTIYDNRGKVEASEFDLSTLADFGLVLPWEDRDGIKQVLTS